MKKQCPICENEPETLSYISNPEKCGYFCCGVFGSFGKDWSEAENNWNETVEEYESTPI